MKIVINGTEYDCVEGSVITRNYNETLDSANIRISHRTEQLNIEPYDVVEIKDFGAGSWYMCVDSYDCIQEGLDPVYYTYEISLFSTVKRLENIILPNIAITPNSENRTIEYYIEQYLNEYASEYSWILSLDTKFNDVCPEMQWNTPTLREVLDDLMMIKDCVCIFSISNPNRITYRDLTYRGTEITDYNYIRRSRSSQDYVSEIRMNLQNAMEDNTNVITEYLPFTTASETDTIMTEKNFIIKTQYPIRKINHLWLNFYRGNYATLPHYLTRVDLITFFDEPLVKEYQEYITMPVYFRPQLASLNVDENNIYQYRNFCLYFQRYSNVVSGLNQILDTDGFSSASLLNIIAQICYNKIYETTSEAPTTWTVDGCEIEYETTQNMVFSVNKANQPRNKRVIMDNQTNSFVNVKVQAALEYQKANRLGNEQLVINQRAESYADVIKLAQMYEDNVVYQVQYQLYENHIEVNAIATKNYVLKNYFTGIKSHIRTWVNARDEAITRHELIKDTYRLSYTQTDTTNNNYYYLQPLLNDYGSLTPVKWCGFQALDENGDPLNNDYYMVDLVVRKLNNSIVFTFGCETNSYVYKYIDVGPYEGGGNLNAANDVDLNGVLKIKSTFLSDTSYGGVPLNFKTYVDNLYENYGIHFVLVYNVDLNRTLQNDYNTYQIYEIYDDTTTASNGIITYLNYQFKSPVRAESLLDYEFEKSVYFHKDNKEISQYSYQLEFLCDDDMYIGEKFIEYQQIIRKNNFTLKYYKADELLYEYDANKMTAINDMVVDFYDNAVAVRYQTAQADNDDYIYVCDTNNNIIFAFKYTQNTIYLNKEV